MVAKPKPLSAYRSRLGNDVLTAVVREPSSGLADIAKAADTSEAVAKRTLSVLLSVGLVDIRMGVDGRPCYLPGWRWRKCREAS